MSIFYTFLFICVLYGHYCAPSICNTLPVKINIKQKVVLWCNYELSSIKNFKVQWFFTRSALVSSTCNANFCSELKDDSKFDMKKEMKSDSSPSINMSLSFLHENSTSAKYYLHFVNKDNGKIVKSHQWEIKGNLFVPFSNFEIPTRAMEGSNAELSCLIYGYPIFRVEWKKSDVILKQSSDYSFSSKNGIENSVLKIFDVSLDESGAYECVAYESGSPNPVRDDLYLYVISKLSPLWPIIGLIIQAIVLFLIIGFAKEPTKEGAASRPLLFRLNSKYKTIKSKSVDDMIGTA